jgi:hypothetical protein
MNLDGMESESQRALASPRGTKMNTGCARPEAVITETSLEGMASSSAGTSCNPTRDFEGIRLPWGQICNRLEQHGNLAARRRGKEVESHQLQAECHRE